MQVTRIQYPVGQGCFHAGHIRWGNDRSNGSGDFHDIYDCGSSNLSTLHDAIDIYRTQTPHINALFVSHLHDDHVNGIDRLLSEVKVNTVYLPYVDEVVSVLHLIEADLSGALSASLVEATMYPRSWFGRRGVSRVVRVLASPGDKSADEEVAAEEFDGSEEQPRRPGARSSLKEIKSGTRVQVDRARHSVDWVLVPHVDPAPRYCQELWIRD